MKNNFKYFLIGFFATGSVINLMLSDLRATAAVIYVLLAVSVAVFWPKKEINIKFESFVGSDPIFHQNVKVTNKNKSGKI